MIEFQEVLISLSKLHKVCNANHLPYNYVKVIDDFSTAWYKLSDKFRISTTPKLHIILHQLYDYFNEINITLKHVTDELVEYMHKFVDKCMTVVYIR